MRPAQTNRNRNKTYKNIKPNQTTRLNPYTSPMCDYCWVRESRVGCDAGPRAVGDHTPLVVFFSRVGPSWPLFLSSLPGDNSPAVSFPRSLHLLASICI